MLASKLGASFLANAIAGKAKIPGQGAIRAGQHFFCCLIL